MLRALGVAAALCAAGPALSAVEINEGFDTENGGVAAADYNSLALFDITSGAVDLVSAVNGVDCSGGGLCLKLRSPDTESATTLIGKQFYAFDAGDIISISIEGRESSGISSISALTVAFAFDHILGPVADFEFFGYSSVLNPGPTSLGLGYSLGSDFGTAGDPSRLIGMRFRALSSGNVQPQIVGTGADDGTGPLADNFSFSITSAPVPEPSTWAMMLIGFGGIGASLRRYRPGRMQAA